MAEEKANEELHSKAELDKPAEAMVEAIDQHDTPSRRELIQRYGKYAVAAAPLLLFVSKAHAIHSRP